jgi:3-oxoacyl-[acyl-carrier-protein] synthase III
MTAVGILGVGAYLPPEVRRNDWWSADTVAGWMELRAAQQAALRAAPVPEHAGAARVHAAILEFGGDPFQGSIERRIMPDRMTSYDLEEAAARDALARAEVAPSDIEVVFTHTAVPDYLVQSAACILHHRLGLPPRCFTVQVDATAFSFLAQLALAEQWIAAGRARCALIVQSCGATRLLDPTQPFAPLFGDGATAVVVGRVRAGRGVLASTHRTDSRYPITLVASVPSGRCFDEGRPVLHAPDPVGSHAVFLAIPEQGREVVTEVLAAARCEPSDVAFFASHQGTPWVRQIVQHHVGLAAARTVDTFPWTASLFSSNIPLVVRRGEDEGLIAPGDLVLLFGGGTGVTYGATLVRWGR